MMVAVVSKLWLMSLQACALIVIVLAVRFFLRKYPKVYSYCLWAIVGLRLLCPIWVELPAGMSVNVPDISTSLEQIVDAEENVSNLETGAQGSGVLIESQQLIENTENIGDIEVTQNGDLGKQEGEKTTSVEARNGTWMATLLKVLTIVYLIGVAVLAIVYLGQYFVLKKRVSTAVLHNGNVWFSENIRTPFVMGVFRPQIYLPYGLDRVNGRFILKHERTHIKHCDPVIRIIGVLCLCLHWWNPLVWLAVHQMNQDMEMFCDEGFLLRAPLAERKSYARALLAFAEKGNGLWAEVAFGESHTEQRVKNILYRKKEGAISVIVVVLVMMLCGCSFLTGGTDTDGSKGENVTQESTNQGTANQEAETQESTNQGTANQEAEIQESTNSDAAEGFDIRAELEKVEEQATLLETKMQEDASLTQLDLNDLAREIYVLWDDELNAIWGRLKDTLSEEEMSELTVEEREWIAFKEAEAEEAGAAYAGGSIADLIVYQKQAKLTRERVYELAGYLDEEIGDMTTAPIEED